MEIRDILKSKWSFIITIITTVIAVISLLFGPGILTRPKILLSCGAIDYKIPVQYELELLTFRMLLSPDWLQKEIRDKLSASLREFGLPEDRIKLFLELLEKEKGRTPLPKTDWKPYELNILKAVMSKLSSDLLPAFLQKYMKLPDGALFFEIDNEGWGSAKNVHVVIRLAGTAYEKPLIDSDNKLLNSVIEGSELSFDYEHIAPKSKTRGIIWYSHMKDIKDINAINILQENEISVSFDRGTVRKKFMENDFFICGRKDDK